MPERSIDPVVKQVVESIVLEGAEARMSEELLLRHGSAIKGLSATRREKVAIELVAVTQRMSKSLDAGWADALVQLSLLTAVALNTLEVSALIDAFSTRRVAAPEKVGQLPPSADLNELFNARFSKKVPDDQDH